VRRKRARYVPDRVARSGIEQATADNARTGTDQPIHGQSAHDKSVSKLIFLPGHRV
jgi:hypothetical protein